MVAKTGEEMHMYTAPLLGTRARWRESLGFQSVQTLLPDFLGSRAMRCEFIYSEWAAENHEEFTALRHSGRVITGKGSISFLMM